METEIVRNWMTPNPITIDIKTPLLEAQALMMDNNIRRLPVTKKGKLVGIVTLGDIREAMPSDVTSLTIHELTYLLDRLYAREFMTGDPVVVSPDSSIADAARLMLEYKVGGLPVMKDGDLVGIITETDFCRLLIAEPELAL